MLFGSLTLAELVGIAIALVVGITFHEFSHALVADQLPLRGRLRYFDCPASIQSSTSVRRHVDAYGCCCADVPAPNTA